MDALRRSAKAFLSARRIAVAGVARDGRLPANVIYRRLRQQGYQVFALNPAAAEVEGDPCWATVADVPGGVDAVVVATPPSASARVVRECAAAGVEQVWIHRSFGQGSASDEATLVAREAGMSLIDGACPMMFLEPVDVPHRCFRWLLGVTGKLPRPDDAQADVAS